MKLLKISILISVFSVFSCLNANSESKQQAKTKVHNLSSERPVVNKDDKKAPEIEVALLLDTSNSMDGLIDQARAQLWDIVNELSLATCEGELPNLKIALYEYGNDNLEESDGFIRQVLPFSDDLDEISKALFSLTTNGGSEYCGQVVQKSTKDLKWSTKDNTLKLIFIAGNEPYTQGQVNYKEASLNTKDQGITVNTIFCGNYDQGVSSYWQEGASLTDGDYMAIDQNKAIVAIKTPYDTEILQLNKKLNTTYLAYGSYGAEKEATQIAQDRNASGYSEANAVKRAVSKSSHLYKNKSWDLVDAVEDDTVVLSELKEADLPNELKGKTDAEIEAYIAKKAAERKNLQEDIQGLNTKRKQFVANKTTSESEDLQNAMLKAIKTQAKTKGFVWN